MQQSLSRASSWSPPSDSAGGGHINSLVLQVARCNSILLIVSLVHMSADSKRGSWRGRKLPEAASLEKWSSSSPALEQMNVQEVRRHEETLFPVRIRCSEKHKPVEPKCFLNRRKCRFHQRHQNTTELRRSEEERK